MADIHSIDCTCDGIDNEGEVASAGTRCNCDITEWNEGEGMETKSATVAMVDLRQVV